MNWQQWSCSTRLAIGQLASSTRLFASFLIPGLLISINAAAQTYQLIELATLSQAAPAVVHGPNSSGVSIAAGRLLGTTGPRLGFVLQNGVGPQSISGLPGTNDTNVFGINDVGALVGSSNAATNVRAFASTLTGGQKQLPPLSGDSASIAFGLNNIQQAVGFSSGPAGERAVIWTASGTPSALPALPGASGSRAMAINDRGDITGDIDTASGRRAVIWPLGSTGTLLPLLPGTVSSQAYAINARGDIVGYAADAEGRRHATLWPSGGAPIDLGTLPNGAFSQAFGLNDAGTVVGTSSTGHGEHAFIWTRGGGLQDLNTRLPPTAFVLTKGAGINNLGAITALGFDPADSPDGHADESHEMPFRVFLLVR